MQAPLLVVHAADDPVIGFDELPFDALRANPRVTTAFSATGGHLGYMAGVGGGGTPWSDEVAISFFEGHRSRRAAAPRARL